MKTVVKSSWNQTPLEQLSDRILNPPTGYCDEPQSFGDSIVLEMKEAYHSVPGEGWFRRLLNMTSYDVVADRSWKMYLAVSRYIRIPTSAERKVFEELLEDKRRLDFLEEQMKTRMVELNGRTAVPMFTKIGVTDEDSARTFAFVHLNGIGYMPNAETMRGAIDNARTKQAEPVDTKPLDLQPL